MSESDTQIAIACQGGGSHTAFTAGVLEAALPAVEDRLVGLSGTSGGALCAVTAWYGLVSEGPDRAAELLEAVWDDLSASTPTERMTNEAMVWGSRLRHSGVPMAQVAPSAIPGEYGQRVFRELLETHIDFAAFPDLAAEADPSVTIGAVEVLSGAFETFTDGEITADHTIASACVPHLFEAMAIDGSYYWDGLFSQNPPVRQFLAEEPKPNEIWVVQINPQTRAEPPRSLGEIADRRNELSGNLSLNQELRFVETVNEWVEAGYLPEEYQQVTVRTVTLDREVEYASKLDRDPDFIESLRADGRAAATDLLEQRSAIAAD